MLTRREVLRDSAIGVAAFFLSSLRREAPVSNMTVPIEEQIKIVEANLPTIHGWTTDGLLQAGVFGLDLTDAQWAKREFALEVILPQMVQDTTYDRFISVQLVRADGGDPVVFAQKLNTAWSGLGKPDHVTKEQWLKILERTNPAILKRWQEIDTLPQIDLPDQKDGQFNWDASLIPAEILAIPEDEHRLVYWMAKAVGTTPWPLDQGRLGGMEWASKRVGEHQYINWKHVATTSFKLNAPSEVGPVGSLPFISPTPFVGCPPLGKWVNP